MAGSNRGQRQTHGQGDAQLSQDESIRIVGGFPNWWQLVSISRKDGTIYFGKYDTGWTLNPIINNVVMYGKSL